MIRIDNLSKTYDIGTRAANEVLHGLSFTLPDTGFVCILGASGCGKTSLLNAIGGLDSFDSGTITTDTAVITRSGSSEMEIERNTNFGYIFQNYYLISDHSATYNIYLGMHSMPLSKKEKMKRVRDALEKVDMYRYRKRPVGQLSGGQQQRIAIARAIARNPKVIFADEPTGNLDEANTMNICSILKELSLESLVIMVTHEERIAKFYADRIITLDGGRIVSDSSEWTRGTMDAGEKDTIYSGDYSEERYSSNGLSIRLLTSDNSRSVNLTVVSENDRIIIKVDDPRIAICSEVNASPKLVDGNRPVLTSDSFKRSEIKTAPDKEEDGEKQRRSGLGFAFLIKEARFLVSDKKLGKLGTGIFIILLSLMIAMSVADIITVASIDPEDFIITDSHVLEFSFHRGSELPSEIWGLEPYRIEFMNYLESSGLDFDYIMHTDQYFNFTDDTVTQLGDLSLPLWGAGYVDISRLDPDNILYGRMPERSDEVVIDRWVIDKLLETDGIIQNVIPNAEYFLGKKLSIDKKTYSPTIVGICDSNEPNIYMSLSAMLSLSAGGLEVMPFSEFKSITGYTKYESLEPGECIALAENAGTIYMQYIGKEYRVSPKHLLFVKDSVISTDKSFTAKFVIADDYLPVIYEEMIGRNDNFSIWCADKDAAKSLLDAPLPEDLEGLLDVDYTDHYAEDYAEYESKTLAKIDARKIVTITALTLSIVMLYFMQRSKVNERMDIVAVYRLLGIPKKDLMTIFAVESLTLTLRYSIPTVLITWAGINIASLIEDIGLDMIYPFWAVGVTLISILAVRVLLAVLPVLRLLLKQPARIAAKYDF